jgi:hypothetical protein
MKAIQDLAQEVNVRSACQALSFPRGSYYRRLKPEAPKDRPAPPLASFPGGETGGIRCAP